MTRVFFVRHAQPQRDWEDDRTRPLTAEGLADSRKVTEFFRGIRVDRCLSSPYIRSVDTIRGSAEEKNMSIRTEERFRERVCGPAGHGYDMIKRRWEDFDFHEEGGESLSMVQERNMEAFRDVLSRYPEETIIIGTHGTALSTILNHYRPAYSCGDFLRIVDYMPYIIRLDFVGADLIGMEELLIVPKEYKGKSRTASRQV